jgi:calcineurin-like phosphoesterase family protein
MSNVWLISDTHFGHTNIIKYANRPFESVEEMDEALVENWNSVVKQGDKVYHLGDVTMNSKSLDIMPRLNGRKVLIKGNHDIQKLKFYIPHFYDIRGSHELNNYLLTHIPVHESQKYRFNANIHGHLHDSLINDPFYVNVSVEQIGYTPIAFDEIDARIRGLNGSK